MLTHNAKLGSYEWLFTKYDKLGRVAYTGLWTDPQQLGRYDLQLQVDEYALTPYERRSATALFATQGAGVNYTCQMFPTANLDIYTVNYYDDYDFSHPGVTVPVATSYGDVLAAPADPRSLKGLPTGSVVRTLNTNTWTYILTGYDAKGRTVWSGQRNNYLAYSQASHSKLDFTGKVTASLTEHTKDA
ncbi:hypothetical protein PN465_21175, partial [Nodularia spumigena CS-584]|nr:hypothetical protein [Nodularia spumigena CS-584]